MRSTDLYSSARDLIRQQEWVEEEDGKSFRNGEAHLELSFDYRNLNVGISPSAITKSSPCEKNIFLKATGKVGSYLDFQGRTRQVDLDSPHFNYVEGRIAHGSMELLIKLVKSNNHILGQLGWKTILSPIIYTAIRSVLEEIDGLDRPIEIETSVDRLEQLIELTTRRVLCDHIEGISFDRCSWHEQLRSLSCTSEAFVQKEEFGGIIDLIVNRGGYREVVDFKFVQENEIDSAHFSDEEACAILTSGESDRWNHIFQVCTYAWILGDARRATLAYMGDNVCSVVQFSVGPQTMAQVGRMLNLYSKKIKKVKAYKFPPPGLPSPQRCPHCPYHMGCLDLSKKSTSFMSEFPNMRVPLLLPVKKINTKGNQLIFDDLNGLEVGIHLISVGKSKLALAEQSIRQGMDLVAYSEVFCDKTDPRSYDVIFAQRPEVWL